MAKFKQGQKVVVSKNPDDNSPGLNDNMVKFFGKTVTIEGYMGDALYKIKEDKRTWAWAERWLKPAQKSFLDIEEETATYLKHNGKKFVIEHRALLARLMQEIKRRPVISSNIETPLLFTRSRYYASRGKVEASVIEEYPQIRKFSWTATNKTKGVPGGGLELAFPIVVFIFTFDNGQLMVSSGKYPRCFYRTSPIASPHDELYHTCLPQVSSVTNGVIPEFPVPKTLVMREQISSYLELFWSYPFSEQTDVENDFMLCLEKKAINSAADWHKKSLDNPYFPMNIAWPKYRLKIGTAVDDLLMKANNESKDGNHAEIINAKQLIDTIIHPRRF